MTTTPAPSPIGDSLLREAVAQASAEVLEQSLRPRDLQDWGETELLFDRIFDRIDALLAQHEQRSCETEPQSVGAPVTDGELDAMLSAHRLQTPMEDTHALSDVGLRAAGNALLALRGGVAQGVVVDDAMVERATAIVLGEGIHDTDTDTLRRVIASALDAALAPQQTEGGQ